MVSIGVDIGTFSIKVAEVEATSKSYIVRRVQEFPLSLDLTKDKKIEIIDTLRTLFQQFDPDQTQFIFALPQKSVSARLVRLPFRERFKVQKAIISQLEDELPFSQEDAIFDAKITKYAGKGADILAMAAPKERIAEIFDLAHDCGVRPLFISTTGMGANNLFENWMEPPAEGLNAEQEIPVARKAEVVVNIGHSSTELLVYVEGMLAALRSIDWGARNIADAIGQKYGLNYLQGMRELQSKGFVMLDKGQGTREQIAFSDVIENSLQPLVADMRLKLLELQSEMNLQWTKGSLIGGGAQLKNLGAFLTQAFEIPFNRYKQFEHHPILNFETNAHLELVSGTAIGLAIEGLKRPRNPATNFLKGEFAQQSHFFEAMWEKWGHAAQVAGVGFLILLTYTMIRDSLSLSLLERSDQVLRTQAQAVANIRGSQATPGRIRQFIANQEKLERSRKEAAKVTRINSALDILQLVSASIPGSPPIEIKRLSINNEMAEVHGYARNENEKSQVLKALRTVAQGGVDVIESRIQTPSGRVGFAYRFKVNRFTGS
ncbi:MAG TPA: pilus assembly protein PilM [Bdellovibrionales bacterium]|nr:pilus assembly protein PilM [Bdellovibrionales bacterium]